MIVKWVKMDNPSKVYTFSSGQVLQLVQGDIIAEHVDAIVNAANSQLMHGAGVAGAIVKQGGPIVQAESTRWVSEHGPVSHTQPAYTRAGNLPCRYVIHAVGPVWGEGDEQEKLSSAIRGSLALADTLSINSIAFPAISTGIFGFPKSLAARVMINTIRDYLDSNPGSGVKLIRLVLYDRHTLQVFMDVWEQDDQLAA
jgi:O-acetyl-ADP-ribose deacetylase (regulator of RNase III)